MALIFERIHTEGIAALSYLIGDDSEGVAAVFDPRPDVDCYLQLAREKEVSITHIFETHIHVDFDGKLVTGQNPASRVAEVAETGCEKFDSNRGKIMKAIPDGLTTGYFRRAAAARYCGVSLRKGC